MSVFAGASRGDGLGAEVHRFTVRNVLITGVSSGREEEGEGKELLIIYNEH